MTTSENTSSAQEIARLKAEAAQAKAEAAQAKAEAAQALLEAKLAAQNITDNITASTETATDTPDSSQNADKAEEANAVNSAAENETELAPDSYAQTVKDAYNFTDPYITIGTFMQDGTPIPGVNVNLPLKMLNRHGLIAGATGSGKTRTLQLLAESISKNGISVFVSDIKGDITGMAEPGESSEKLLQRTNANGQPWAPSAQPLEIVSLGDTNTATPIRTTITDMGPLLLARILEINETQESAISLVFHWADQNGLALVDLSDIRAVFTYLTSEDGRMELDKIGGISSATAGVILRQISSLESQGGAEFFGETAFNPADLLRVSSDGQGIITCLELPEVQNRPKLLSTFIMWILADLFNTLPEVGDLDQPKIVFFFDEAHLLFQDASKAFLAAITQTVRLIRSKGVGVFFITQTPKDVPADVLAQLGARIQHVLRAFTPIDNKNLKATVETFPNSPYKLEEVLTNLGIGEAVVTILDAKGKPSPVTITKLWAPSGVMGPASQLTLNSLLNSSTLLPKYKQRIDPESAAEVLTAKMQASADAKIAAKQAEVAEKEAVEAEKEAQRVAREQARQAAQNPVNKVMNTVLSTAARTVTTRIIRSIFGTRGR